MAYDILIKSGIVLDGAGNALDGVDIGVKNGEIADIGTLNEKYARKTINAHRKYVTPGFIDITNHSDTRLTLFHYPHAASMLMQGVTTMIGGNCGASLAPLGSHVAIDAIRKWADPSRMNINWATVEEFLRALERFSLGAHFGTLIGFGTLRRGVIADEVRALTLDERDRIKFLLREGMQQGAFGLSLGLAYGHERAAPTEEIIDIASVIGETGGVVKIHLASEGTGLLESMNEAIRISREAGVPVIINHLKAIGKKAWPLFEKGMELLNTANASGADVAFDVYPYNSTGSPLYLLIPGWARRGGFNELFKRMDDKREREHIIASLREQTLHYESIVIGSAARFPALAGKTIATLSKEMRMGPEEIILEIIRANNGRVTIIGRTISEDNTRRAILHDRSVIASDAAAWSREAVDIDMIPHPRSFGTFPRFWNRFVNELRMFSPEEAIKKMTSRPAEILGIKNRGILKKGYAADITIFDPLAMKDRATYDNPFQYPAGIEWVIVNGGIAVEDGKLTEKRLGRVVRRGH